MAMAISTTGPTELFNLLQPRFREIELSVMISTPMDSTEPEKVFFMPKNAGSCYHFGSHALNIDRDTDLAVHFVFDRSKNRSHSLQMLDSVWKAVLNGPFAGRKFYADPDKGAIEKAFRMHTLNGSFGRIPIAFSHDGNPIPGLHLRGDMHACTPFFFVPKRSPEGRAIHAALELEQARLRESKRVERGEKSSSLEFLRDGLSSALAAVSG